MAQLSHIVADWRKKGTLSEDGTNCVKLPETLCLHKLEDMKQNNMTNYYWINRKLMKQKVISEIKNTYHVVL